MSIVPFAAWRPDSAHLNSEFTSDVSNVLRAGGFYIPFPQLEPFSEAVAEQPVGGITVRDSAGQVHIFVGTPTKLYKLDTATRTWDDVSKASTSYSASVDERWRFRQFGDFVVAVNINDDPQVYEIGSSTEFDDLAGSPPRARHIAVWGDHLALMDGRTASWSDTDDITNWSTGNSGSQTFPDGGEVQGATDATNPFILQKAAIRAGTFVPGSQLVFTFTKVHEKRGCAAPYSICSRGEFTFFADSGAFQQLMPDGTIVPIGAEKVDRTMFGVIGGGELASIYGEIDPFHPRVYFALRVESTTNAFDHLLVYDWQVKEWTRINASMDILFPLASGTVGYSLEGLDAISSSLDDLPFSLDSKVWQGGAPVMAAFDIDNKLGFFSGENAEAVLTTSEIGDTTGRLTFMDGLYPIIDTNELFVEIGTRMKRGDNRSWTDELSPSVTGRIDRLSESRFHTFRVKIPAAVEVNGDGNGNANTWTAAQGIDISARVTGWR